MKVKYFLMLVIASLCLASCGKDKLAKQEKKDTKQKEVVYTDHIQDTFFGVKFGASKEELIEAFKQHNLYLNGYSTDSWLAFEGRSKYFDFGGLNWSFVRVGFNNDKFYTISFLDTPENKVTALDRFERVFDELSKKYKMNELPIQDTNTYKRYNARTKDEKIMGVFCFKAESLGGEMRYYVSLDYYDEKLMKEVSDEL